MIRVQQQEWREDDEFESMVARKHLALARFATRTHLGKSMEVLLSPFPELMQLPYLQDEVRKIGCACVSVTDTHGEYYIPFIGLLGLNGSDLTESKSIPVLATVVIKYLKTIQPGSQWDNLRDGDYTKPRASMSPRSLST